MSTVLFEAVNCFWDNSGKTRWVQFKRTILTFSGAGLFFARLLAAVKVDD
jgi:hypothetical protein